MAEKENKRKCFKCGCSPAEDNIKLFRFPKPAIRNLVRCELWARYIFPERDYSSKALQMKLYSEHRMLCQKHFIDADFTDESKSKLFTTAVPCDTEHELPLPIISAEPQAGPSQRIFRDLTNVSTIQSTEPIAGIQKEKTDKEKTLYAKCCKYLKSICQLRHRVKNLKSQEVLKAINEDMAVKKLCSKISPAFALLLLLLHYCCNVCNY